jgi:hypothetical protein
MPIRFAIAALLVFSPTVAAAQDALIPDEVSTEELVLPSDHIITVTIDGVPLRLEVTAEASGPLAVNPQIAERMGWQATFKRYWDFGEGEPFKTVGLLRTMRLGDTTLYAQVVWGTGWASKQADGVIGVHQLPYERVTFPINAVQGEQTVQRIPLIRIGGRNNTTIGTRVETGQRPLSAFFTFERGVNVLTAPTAEFIATRFDGGFLPGSDGVVELDYGVQRKTRTMRLARPLQLGDLMIDHFAVRYSDYGSAKRVGEIAPDDPRFKANEIIVSRRKPKGRVDYLTRLGRDLIAHCSALTYDFELEEIRLTCGAAPH